MNCRKSSHAIGSPTTTRTVPRSNASIPLSFILCHFPRVRGAVSDWRVELAGVVYGPLWQGKPILNPPLHPPRPPSRLCVAFIEATLRHILGPGAIRGIAPRWEREGAGEPFFRPPFHGGVQARPPATSRSGNASGTVCLGLPSYHNIPLSRSPSRHYVCDNVAAYAADPRPKRRVQS